MTTTQIAGLSQELFESTHTEVKKLDAQAALVSLSLADGQDHLYRAADPGYPGNFTRDGIIAAVLGGDTRALWAQVDYSARYQGKQADPLTGQEKGKIHHELPSVDINGASSAYNACDTTALFLSSISYLADNGEPEILDTYAEEISEAIAYIQRHIKDGLFTEDPTFAEAEKFGLKVTYWKDSALNHPERQEPHYPIVYSLAHFQNADALAKVGKSLDRDDLRQQAMDMQEVGLDKLWRGDHFVTAIDASGDIDPISSDSLSCLLYISPEDLSLGQSTVIEHYMKPLITPAGYRTGLPTMVEGDPYHTDFVWTHEQALLHAAARKHDLKDAQDITEQVVSCMDGQFPELIHAETLKHAGNNPQLWAVQTHFYFQNPASALL